MWHLRFYCIKGLLRFISPFYRLVNNLYTLIIPKWYLNLIKKLFYPFHQVLQINLRAIIKKKCIFKSLAFRDFQIDLCKTVVSASGHFDGLALNRKHDLHLRHWN